MKRRLVSLLVVITILVSMFAVPANYASAQSGPLVMAYYTAGTSGTSMSYMDDSLHLAYSTDGTSWTALNDNNGILFKTNKVYKAAVTTNIQFRDPFLFKKQDGTYVLLATAASNTGATTSKYICAWDSSDLLTYTNERLITTDTVAIKPQCKFDSGSGSYVIYWTDGTTMYSATTTDFTSALTGTAYTGTEYPIAVSATLDSSLKATPGSVISVTQAELDKLTGALGTPKIPTGTKDITLTTKLNTQPSLPNTADVQYSDGTTVQKEGITWDAVNPDDLAKQGTITVKGHINGTQDYINPLIKNGADPDIYKGSDGYYYYTSSYMDAVHSGTASYQYDRIALRRAKTIQGLATAEEKTIFTKYSSGDASYHIWAPEIHEIGSKWYIYFAGGKASSTFDLRAYVLECSGDPMVDIWGTPDGATGVVAGGPAKISMINESFDLDATVFEHNGEMYMCYAYAYGTDSVPSSLRIAKMVNPYTLGPDQITISGPEYVWEHRKDNVIEAPTVMKKNGKIFMGYSAGSTDSTYAIGLLTAVDSPSTNLLDPASWTKTPYPLMCTAPQNGQYGPGHCTFTVGEDGQQDVLSYHARENEKYSGVSSYNPLYDASRWARVQNIYWHANGTPYLGVPAKDGYLPGTGVTATVNVIADAGTIMLDEKNTTVEVDQTYNIVLKKAVGDGTAEIISSSEPSYSSSDPSVAVVSKSGIVKAISAGSAIIAIAYGGATLNLNVTVPNPTSDSDMILRYKLDETSGTVAKDSSGHNNDGTLSATGATWTNGNGIFLDGAAGYVKMPNGILTSMSSITITADVYINSANKNPVWLCSFSSTDSAAAGTKYLGILQDGGGKFRASITNNYWTAEQTVSKGSGLVSNTWNKVVYTYSGTTATLYVNGTQVGQNTGVTLKPSDMEATVANYIGRPEYTADKYLNGSVSDFRIYNKAMTSWEVKLLGQQDNAAAVAADKDALTLGDTSAVTSNLQLTTSGALGTTITWQSSDPTVVAADGTVTVPTGADKTAVLTATITKGALVDFKDFTVTVKGTKPANVVLWYKLDETLGTVANDASGNGNNGTLKGSATWLEGKGISLDGSSGYIQMPNGILSGLDSITVSTSVYLDATNPNPSWIFSFGSTEDPYSDANAHYLGLLLNASQYRATLTQTHWSNEQNTLVSSAFPKGVWKNVTYTQTGATGTLYVDGAQVAQSTALTLKPSDMEATIANYIGRPAYKQDKYIKGQYKNFIVYNRALSASEVQALAGKKDSDYVELDLAALTLGNLSAVKTDIKLPSVGANGCTITWASSDENTINSTTGKVTRPLSTQTDEVVTLTATITKGTASATKTFTATVIKELSDTDKIKLDAEALIVRNIDDIRGNLYLPVKGQYGTSITWASENTSVITATGEVIRPANGSGDRNIKLTATISLNGISITKAFKAVVRQLPVKQDPSAYLFAYFIGEGTSNGEQMYFALSNGNDPLNWTNMNGGKPVFTSNVGTKGVRDPSIVRSPDGDKFYMIATDLKMYGYGDWTAAQKTGSQYIVVWESTDLVHWTNQRLAKVSSDLAGCTWAPEAFYDKTTGEYVVYWASKMYSDATKSDSPNQRIMYAKTRDFYTFTEAKELYNPGYSVIDSTMIENNGKIYRFTKDERSYNATSSPNGKMVFEQVSDSIFGNFTTLQEGIGKGSISVGEGPLVFKANGENKWYLFIDYFSAGGYKPFYTTDLNLVNDTWHYMSSGYSLPSPAPRHGTVLPITAAEYAALQANLPVEVSTTGSAASVTLDKTDLTLQQGEQAKLTATVLPADTADKTVLWSSSHETVARVDENGNVTAIADNGTTVITATSVSGAHIATCTVTVKTTAPVQKPFTIVTDEKLLRSGGLEARVQIQPVQDAVAHDGDEVVVFMLMMDNTPTRIIGVKRDITATDEVVGYFNVNPNDTSYTVRVYVLDQFNSDISAPISLAESKILK